MTKCPILKFVQQKIPLYKNVFNKHYYIKVKPGCVLCTSNLQTLLIDFDKRVSKYQAIENSKTFLSKAQESVIARRGILEKV